MEGKGAPKNGFWWPDSSAVGWVKDGIVWRYPLDSRGVPPEKILNLAPVLGPFEYVISISMSPDAKIFYVSYKVKQGQEKKYLISAVDIAAKKAALLGTGWRPALDQHGRRLAILENRSLYVQDVGEPGSRAKVMDDSLGRIMNPCWSPDGAYVAFTVSKSPDYYPTCYAVRLSDKKLIKLTKGRGSMSDLTWSGDGYIYFSGAAHAHTDYEVWRFRPGL